MASFMDTLFGTADTAASDAAKRQQGITSAYKTGVSKALSPYSSLASSADQQGLFSNYLAGLTSSNPSQYAVSANDYALSAPDVSASAVQSYLDPSIDYQTKQATGSVEASQAGKGGLFSGAAGKEISSTAQDIAKTGWENAYNKARTAGLDANTAASGNFGQALQAGQFANLLGQQGVENLGTAYSTAMEPLNTSTQSQLDMLNTLFGTQSGLNQQQMQGQFADTGLFSSLLNAGVNLGSKAMAGA